jgi:hypothetical protein
MTFGLALYFSPRATATAGPTNKRRIALERHKTILSSHSQSPHNKDNRGMHPNGRTNQEEVEEARARRGRQLYDRRGLAVWLGGAR